MQHQSLNFRHEPGLRYHFRGFGNNVTITLYSIDKTGYNLEATFIIEGVDGLNELTLRNGDRRPIARKLTLEVSGCNISCFYTGYNLNGPYNCDIDRRDANV